MRILTVLGLILMFGCASPKHFDPVIASELEAMRESDQSQRGAMKAAADEYGYDSPQMKALLERQGPIDEANTRRLVAIIEEAGWPGRSVAGDSGSFAAFLILQHADIKYQKQYLPLVRKAAAEGELRADLFAMLEDRVLMGEGKKQIYGTQLKPNAKGGYEFYPIDDVKNVDERRARVGLPPIGEAARQWGIQDGVK